MEIIWAMTGFFIFVTMVFVVIAVFFPEWVGITGKKAHDIMEDHQSPTSKDQFGNETGQVQIKEPKVKDPKL